MSQYSGLYTGLSTEYGLGTYGRFGYSAKPSTSSEYNPDVRTISERSFFWSPVRPTEWNLPTGINGITGGKFEITSPASYELAITPDLRYPLGSDQLKEYDPSEPFLTNSILFVKRESNPEYLANTNLLRITLTEDEMAGILSSTTEYLWAVRAIGQYGERSAWSEIRRFKGIYELPYEYVGVSYEYNDVKPYMTIVGQKHPHIEKIEVNGDYEFTRYINNERWEYDVVLSGGTNYVNIRGLAKSNRPTQYTQLDLTLPTGAAIKHELYNVFDDYAARVGVSRLRSIDENNSDLKRRVQDVFVHPAGSNIAGLHNSICRNLDLDYDDAALVVTPATGQDYRRSDAIFNDLTLEIGTNYAYVGSSSFKVNGEYHRIDPRDLSVQLNHQAFIGPENESITIKINSQLPQSAFRYDAELNKVIFNSDDYAGKECWVTYSKKISIAIYPSVTLSSLVTSLNALTFNGHRVLSCGLSSQRTGTEDSGGLLRGIRRLSSSNRYTSSNDVVLVGTPIRWSEFNINKITDNEYASRYRNKDGHLLNTRMESFVNVFKGKARFSIESTINDEDVWDPVDGIASYLPGALDAQIGYWITNNDSYTGRIPTSLASELGFKDNLNKTELVYVGVPQADLQSGIGYKDDLKTFITKDTTVEELTPPNIYRGTMSIRVTGLGTNASYLPDNPLGGMLFTP